MLKKASELGSQIETSVEKAFAVGLVWAELAPSLLTARQTQIEPGIVGRLFASANGNSSSLFAQPWLSIGLASMGRTEQVSSTRDVSGERRFVGRGVWRRGEATSKAPGSAPHSLAQTG